MTGPSVLDATAIVALTRGEPGGGDVRDRLRSGGAIAAVNLGEALDRLVRATLEPERVAEGIDALVAEGLRVVDCDWGLTRRAAEIRSTHYHRRDLAVSLADCIAVATAEQLELPLVTSDREQARVARALGLALHPIANSRGVRPES